MITRIEIVVEDISIISKNESLTTEEKELTAATLGINKKVSVGERRILEVACLARAYDALIVHADADAPISDKAFHERFKPGYELVQQARAQSQDKFCEYLLPLIPVRMTEAWMLADYEILIKEIGTANICKTSRGRIIENLSVKS